jgi:predicted CXXCH cytochrome family protein
VIPSHPVSSSRKARPLLFALAGGILLMSALALSSTKRVTATAPDFGAPPPQGISNATCLECHGQPELSMQLDNGETLSLYVDAATFNDSVHGAAGYACVQCHTSVGDYPHPEFSAKDLRDAELQLYDACQRCHTRQYDLTQDSSHQAARDAGNRAAAVCTDCHGAHDTQRMTDPETRELLPEMRLQVPRICAQCHSAIYDIYETSVHGAALVQEENTDVPTCIDCHGVHSIEDPTTTEFRLKSPQLCAGCHTDPELMEPYGLSTQVLDTYVADFHGTTVTLFEKLTPDAETNKPVCYDCHGVHDILPVDDPVKGLQVRENLLARCQRCHPNATANFPDAWLSHYIPSPDHSPLTYYVDLFYKVFIPAVLGFMVALVALDLNKRLQPRYRPILEQPRKEEPPAPETVPDVEEKTGAEAPEAAEEGPPTSGKLALKDESAEPPPKEDDDEAGQSAAPTGAQGEHRDD